MAQKSTLRLAADFLVRLFAPLREATEDVEAFRAFFLRLGWALGPDDIPAAYLTLADDILDAITIVQDLPADVGLGDVDAVFNAVSAIYADLRGLPPPSGVSISAPELATEIVDLLTADFLVRELPQVWNLLRHLGLTESRYFPAQSGPPRRAFVSHKVLWGDLPKVLADPGSIPSRVYGWGSEAFDFRALSDDLMNALSAFDVHARSRTLGTTGGTLAMQAFVEQADQVRYGQNVALDAILMDAEIGDQVVEVGVSLLALPGEGTHKPGLVVQPLVPENLIETIQLNDNLTLVLKGAADLGTAFGVVVRPGETPFPKQPFAPGATPLAGDASVALETTFDAPVVLLGSPSGSRVDVAGLRAAVEFLASTAGAFEARFDLGLQNVSVVLKGGDGDGFVGSVLGSGEKKSTFSFGLRWSTRTGLSFTGAGGFGISTPVNLSVGPIHFRQVDLAIGGQQRASGAGALIVSAGVALDATLGPITAVVDGIGVHTDIAFEAGNAGPFDVSAGFKPPTGVGIAVDAGSVTGGGFLSFKDGTYSGALELKVYSVSVKAFGVIETKLPNGQSGYSFAIVISAEFNPVQLGFGFTLNGVGGIIGINRRIDQDALAKGVRTGALERLLFPHDVVHDAPQIIHDLQAVLPPTDGRYVFGPLAKIGWGTPTIIEAELGLILELPGPRLAVLGEVSALLPKKDKGIITLNLSVAGLLDFPKKYFAIDASLHDSKVGSYPVSGDMAMRMSWGDSPTFALAVGGFNPAFQPPAGFPALRRVAVDLGVSGNPSLTLQGYFALTSNTAQCGALAELNASGSGVTLYARLQWDALIVFSPFSFEVDIAAQVSVKFHGHGITAHLKGMLSGPSPWFVRGEVCVSILWWDACLSFSKTFGSGQKVELPQLDPWLGTNPVNGSKEVLGLQEALQDARNWTPEPPPAVFAVVSLANSATEQLFDPLGVAVVKQTVCPFNLKLQRFGSAKAAGAPTFVLQQAKFDGAVVTGSTFNKEPFAKGQFVEMTNAQKLSAPAFEPFDGAIRVPANDNKTRAGSMAGTDITYQTKVLGASTVEDHPLPESHQQGMVRRSAAGLYGLRRTAAQAYLNPTATPRFTVGLEEFVIGNKNTLTTVGGLLTSASNKLQAALALASHLVTNPEDRDVLQVYPKFELGGR